MSRRPIDVMHEGERITVIDPAHRPPRLAVGHVGARGYTGFLARGRIDDGRLYDVGAYVHTDEHRLWIRGHYDETTVEGRALLAAYALQ